MIASISKFTLRLFGWHTSATLPEGVHQAVLIVAPHTSMMDFVIGRLTFWSARVKIRVLIKKEVFVPLLGWFLRRLGGLPVDRGRNNNLIGQVARMFSENQELIVVITPEGTRKKVTHWKKGFYLIALQAKVPIALGYIDYGRKTGGIGPLLVPTGNFDADMKIIREYYRDKTARHPERFNLTPSNPNE